MEKLLTTKEVANILQSSESSVKRWCDQDSLDSVRTPGGHRRVTMAAVLDFARSKGKADRAAEMLGISSTEEAFAQAASSHKALVESFKKDDSRSAEAAILSAFANGKSVAQIADELIAPAMHEVGNCWESGDIAIYQERQACGMVDRALHRLAAAIPPKQEGAPVAIGATLENDHYTLASKLGTLVLMQQGWDARLLGSNIPFESIARAALDYNADLVWVSISYIQSKMEVIDSFNRHAQSLIERGVSIVIGGRCTDTPLRNEIVYTFYGQNMQSFANFCQGAPRRKK